MPRGPKGEKRPADVIGTQTEVIRGNPNSAHISVEGASREEKTKGANS